MTSKDFSEYTLEFNKTVSKLDKQKLGKYPTPYPIIEKLFEKIPSMQDEKKEEINILEPSIGTGQILDIIDKYDKYIDYTNLYGFEIEKELSNHCEKKFKNAIIKCGDFLEQNIDIKFNYILANPPYFEIKNKEKIKEYKKNPEFKDVILGKINIFYLFLKKCLDLLKKDGYLSFIIPVSFLNGRYYEPLRKYIVKNFNIIDIEIINKHSFSDTQVEVMIITIKKEQNNGDYIIKKDKLLIFSIDWKIAQQKLNEYDNIKEIGGKVSTGNMVWNQNKEHLVIRKTKSSIPIIYAENIINNKIVYKKIDKKNGKKQYIKRSIVGKKINVGPAIVVNRIIGAKNIKITCAIVDKDHEFVGENHVNVITHPDEKILQEIYTSLNSKDTLEHIKNIRGNVQLSQSDLQNLIPIKKKLKKN